MSGLKLDAGQFAAYAVDSNAVVSAGAGSGKTTVLAERYVRLVTERGLDVDSILTLTFTRKAAAEMYARIYNRLSEIDHPRAREQLAAFDTARIMTLDAFCANVTRGACHRYGVPPDFSIDEARLSRIADEVAVEILMDRREEEALRRLVAARSFDRIRTDFLVDVAVRSISLVSPPAFAQDAIRQAQFLEARIRESSEEIERLGAEIVAIDETGATGVTLPKAKDAVKKALPLPRGLEAADLEALSEAARFLSSKESFSKPGSNAQQSALIELRELAGPLKDLAKELRTVVASYAFRDDAIAVGKILDDFAQRFLVRKRREGLLSFHDAAELAVDILTRDIELRSHYKNKIRAIMIDEFQDDNELQKNLLYLLAERADRHSEGIPCAEDLAGDKLFFVGDEKQSIYRFRGADVSVFRKLASELDPDGRAALSLNVNYRSSGELVAFFNAVFPGIFGDAIEEFEAAFSEISAKPAAEDGDPVGAKNAPPVEFHVLVRSSSGETDTEGDDADLSFAASEAFAAARRVAIGVAKSEFGYGDIAVLFRSTTRQHEYERAFRLLEIPFVASDPRGVFEEGPANDMYSLLRLALFPGDRNAYAAVLRSPFVKLGDDSLARIFLAPRFEPFPDDADASWFTGPDDARRFARGRSLYRSVLDTIDRKGAATVIANLWYDGGYRSSILSDPDAATCLDHFDALFDLALDADRRRLSLSAFLDELAPLMGTSEKTEGGDPGESVSAVRFMTVHKSKGLEFPVVLIADAGNEGRGLRNARPYFRDGEFGVAVTFRSEHVARDETAPNYFYERARSAEEARETAELRRLLYVAATRAERRLLFFGSRKVAGKEAEELFGLGAQERAEAALRTIRIDRDGFAAPRSFFDLVASALASSRDAEARFSVAPLEVLGERQRRRLAYETLKRQAETAPARDGGTGGAREGLTEFYRRVTPRIPVETKRRTSPSALERAAIEDESGTALGEKLPSLEIDPLLQGAAMETAFGTLCHHLIERRMEGEEDSVPHNLDFGPLSEAERTSCLLQARRLAEGFFHSELGRAALAAERRFSEFPFLLPLPREGTRPYLINGAMDLIYESSGRCVIVDFKTDQRMEPEKHSVQLAAYRAAASAYSDLPVETWLFYLRGGISRRVAEVVPLERLVELAGRAISAAASVEDD